MLATYLTSDLDLQGCGAAFSSLMGYQYHQRRCGKPPCEVDSPSFPCTHCGKTYRSKAGHDYHVRSEHTAPVSSLWSPISSWYSCSLCYGTMLFAMCHLGVSMPICLLMGMILAHSNLLCPVGHKVGTWEPRAVCVFHAPCILVCTLGPCALRGYEWPILHTDPDSQTALWLLDFCGSSCLSCVSTL